jgi:hypothetical protein
MLGVRTSSKKQCLDVDKREMGEKRLFFLTCFMTDTCIMKGRLTREEYKNLCNINFR